MNQPDLEMTASEFEKHIKSLTEVLVQEVKDQPHQATKKEFDKEAFKSIFSGLDKKWDKEESIFGKDLLKALGVGGVDDNTPGYMGSIPGGGLLQSSLGDFLTSVINRWPGLYEFAPGILEIEKEVIQWLCQVMGLKAGAGGIFTSGGSMANFNSIYVSRINKLGDEFSHGTIYISDQAHYSFIKSVKMAGIAPDKVRKVKTLANCTMCPQHLKELVEEDIQKGLRPFLVGTTAGTTQTGAIDPLKDIAEVCKEHDCWFHVDAAWGGSYRLTKRGKLLMKGIENADSITIDPHKAFWTPWGCGAFLVADPRDLYQAFSVKADYLPFEEGAELTLNPANISGELSRNARGLQLWLPIKLCGAEAFTKALNEKLDLAYQAFDSISKMDGLSLIHPPALGIVSFSFEIEGASEAYCNKLTEDLLDRINQDDLIYLTGTTVKEKFLARIAPMHFRTHKKHVDYVLDLVDKHRREILREIGYSWYLDRNLYSMAELGLLSS